ncbi:adenylate/guanylate cyclase domain-containing protein [Nocardia stercoris]|uniref:Adenylate/guanylate cyclase domain-containing protein n=1 Tax=Nocardia stercoris TaxID=2483361 RepID=A0A3M2L7L2_9NOCA|nr:adenylate/guanylate cyclase domain-containing protein [Nocardia stercoris]RMI32710.1 adenylate/guanylate cyclase domain-containing protein [Nocardia stercoris]
MSRTDAPMDEGLAPWGSRLLGTADEDSKTRRIRVQSLLSLSLIGANLLAVAMTVVLACFVLPGPPMFTRRLLLLNVVLVPVWSTSIIIVGTVWSTVVGLRALGWAQKLDHVPDERQRRAAARAPRTLTLEAAVLWIVTLIVLTTAYGAIEPLLIPKIALAILGSSIMVCANTYLVVEFGLRPITARILEVEPQRARHGVGVFGRTMLTWTVGVIPVAVAMAVAVWALADPTVSKARLAVCMLSLGGSTLGFGMLLMAQLTESTVAPIRGVRQALRRVENGDLQTAVTVYDGTELGELQSGFNTMVAGLRERALIEDLFGKHVGRDVALAAISSGSELGGTETDAAALFIDIIGSTTMTATRPAAEIVALLNRFFGIVVDEVERHGGLLNKFEGDAALAVFGTPAPLPDQAAAALSCGRAIQRRLSAAPDLQAGIGVAAGRVVAGNVGTHNRYEFTVIGDAVNEAARLCELSKSYDELLLTSATTLAAAGAEEAANWRLGETVTLRGRVSPTQLAFPQS